MAKLWVVMPVFNEEDNVEHVIREWLPELRKAEPDFIFCAVNDGSSDGTAAVLEAAARAYPELKVVDKPNSGHGQSCVEGYRRALAQDARWIFQMDSDGQCDPKFFAQFWANKSEAHPVYGYRRQREDGYFRFLMSRTVGLTTFAATGVWVKDPNVPYRLMHATTLSPILKEIPTDFQLANILISVLQQEKFGLIWLDISFRKRFSGAAKVKGLQFARRGLQLFRQLRLSH